MTNTVWGGAPCFFGWNAVQQDRLTHGLQSAACGQSLDYPSGYSRISCGRLAAMPHSTEAMVKTAIDQRK